VEIKGVPRIPLIPELVHYEAFRQRALLDIRELLAERGVTEGAFGVSRYPMSNLEGRVPLIPFLYRLDSTLDAAVVVIPGFRGILGWPLGPTRAFADELSDLVRVVACIDRLPNLYTDELPGRGILPEGFFPKAREEVGAGEDDAVLLLWGPPRDLDTAIGEVRERCRYALVGVPPETRQRLVTGETRFERVLPGPDRMYPDTDLPPLAIPDARIERIRARIPEPLWERRGRLERDGLPSREVTLLASSPRYGLYCRAVDELGVAPKDGMRILLYLARAIGREGRAVAAIPEKEWASLLTIYGSGRFAREALPDVIRRMADGGAAAEAVEDRVPSRASAEEVADAVASTVAAAPRIADPGARTRHLMGSLMARLRGAADGREVSLSLERALAGGAR
jgi:glutamyl-tRNA(Gln) amidotransferase subunit E